jgi:replicative DNA helicase
MAYSKRRTKKPLTVLDYGGHLPPQNQDMEVAVLGAIMSSGKYIDKIMSDFNRTLFFNEQNALICDAIIDLQKENKPIDAITIISKLRQNNTIDRVGGMIYVMDIISKVSSAANLEYYIRILQQEALKRKIITVCSESIQKTFDNGTDVFDVYQNLQKELDTSIKEVVKFEVTKIGAVHEKILVDATRFAEEGIKSGVTSGLIRLDNVTNGWQKSDLIILAGRPSMGKTSMAISLMIKPAIVDKKAIAIFSLEMSREQLVARMQSDLSEINVSKIVKKQLTLQEIYEISSKSEALETADIFIDDTPSISLLEMKGKVRKLVKESNVELVIVDYLQLMKSGLDIQNREQEIAEISRGLKGLAKELDIPIIALSQLSRAVESRGGDKKPMLSDLRESGQIEQDADMILFCYRPEYYGIDSYEIDGNVFESHGLFMLLISKHRNGELGEIPLKFIHQFTKITNHDYDVQQSEAKAESERQNNETEKPEVVEPKQEKPSGISFYELGLREGVKNDDTPF